MIEIREIQDYQISAAAVLKSENWGTKDYWIYRINGYLNLELHPKHALKNRVLYVALKNNKIVGLIAGHLTKRYNCDGELQWINVQTKHQKQGVATSLLKILASWFVQHNAQSVCVDIDPENIEGIHFYKKQKAQQLNAYWMVWPNISEVI